ADTIHLAIEQRKLQQVFAWGDSTRPHAVSTLYTILADSLALDLPNEVLTEARAYRKALATSKKDSTAKADVNWIAGDTIVARWAAPRGRLPLPPPMTRRRGAPAPADRPPRHTPISRARRAAPHRALRGARPVARPRRGGSGAHRRRARRGHLRRARHRLSRRVSEVAGLRQGIEPPPRRQSLGGRCPHPPPD